MGVLSPPPTTADVVTQPDLDALALQVHENVKALSAKLRNVVLALGAQLRLVQEFELWRVLGYASFEEYLADPDVSCGFGRRHLYRAIRVSRAFVPTLSYGHDGAVVPEPAYSVEQVAALGISKADLIAPIISDPATPQTERDEWFAKASTLSYRDLRVELTSPPAPLVSTARARIDRVAAQLRALVDRLDLVDDPLDVLTQVIVAAAEARDEWEKNMSIGDSQP